MCTNLIIYLLYNYSLSYHFLKNFLPRCASSIAFNRPLRNESMQCALPNPFIAYFWFFGSLSLTDSFQTNFTENTHKIAQNCVYNVQKLFAGGGGRKKGGKTSEWGGSAMVVGGIDAPGHGGTWYICGHAFTPPLLLLLCIGNMIIKN